MSSFQWNAGSPGRNTENSGSAAASRVGETGKKPMLLAGARTTGSSIALATSWAPRHTPNSGTPRASASRSRSRSLARNGNSST